MHAAETEASPRVASASAKGAFVRCERCKSEQSERTPVNKASARGWQCGDTGPLPQLTPVPATKISTGRQKYDIDGSRSLDEEEFIAMTAPLVQRVTGLKEEAGTGDAYSTGAARSAAGEEGQDLQGGRRSFVKRQPRRVSAWLTRSVTPPLLTPRLIW